MSPKGKKANKKKNKQTNFWFIGFLALIVILFGLYSVFWFEAANTLKTAYVETLDDFETGIPERIAARPTPNVTGYPGPLRINVNTEVVKTRQGEIRIHDINMRGWPFPFIPFHVKIGEIEIESYLWNDVLRFDSLETNLSLDTKQKLSINEGILKRGEFTATVDGTLDLTQEPLPRPDLIVTLDNHIAFSENLIKLGIVEKKTARFTSAGLSALGNENGLISIPITQNGQTILVGPLPVYSVPVRNP